MRRRSPSARAGSACGRLSRRPKPRARTRFRTAHWRGVEWAHPPDGESRCPMAVPMQPASRTDRILRELEIEHQREADGRSAAWGFLWTLFAFKIATALVIVYAASGTGESVAVVL